MQVLRKSGQIVAVEQFRSDHPGAVFSGNFPPTPLAVALGYQVENLPKPQPGLAESRSVAKRNLAAWIDRTLAGMLSEYPQIEQDGFTAKSMAAIDVLANVTPHPVGNAMLQAEAAQRQMSVSDLAQLVKQKADQFSAVQSAMASARHKASQNIDQATTPEDVGQAYKNAQSAVFASLQTMGMVT
jgi:hypothetical protein